MSATVVVTNRHRYSSGQGATLITAKKLVIQHQSQCRKPTVTALNLVSLLHSSTSFWAAS
jgi:hypothetical protein